MEGASRRNAAEVRRAPLARPDVERQDLERPDWLAGRPRPSGSLWLDKNENLDPELGSWNRRLIAELDPQALATYPELTPLYKKLAAFLGVPAKHLIFTHGSDGAIRSVFEAYVSPGDRVLHTSPTFAMYPVYSKMYGAAVTALEYQRSEAGPVLSAAKIRAEIERTRPRLICLPNPDSPTGNVLPPAELRSLIEAAAEEGALVLVDEAYHPFYEHSVVDLVPEVPNLVVARTFAKAWGLAGLRAGCAVASETVAQRLHKVRPMYEMNTIAVDVLGRALDHPEHMLASVRRLNEGKHWFLGEMRALGFATIERQGNFLHVAFGDRSEAVFRSLDGAVLFRRGFAEECLKGYSRFSSTTTELFRPIAERIRRGAAR